MEIILYLSVALIAIAFFVLVIYLAKTLKSLQVTLTSVSNTLTGLEKQLDGVTTETTILLHKTNALADDIQLKSERLNSVVEAVKDVGTTVSQFNGTLKNITNTVDQQVEESKEKISQIVQWSNIFLELKDKWQARKQSMAEVRTEERQRVRGH
ncbi:hypothetical protein BABA_23320 [Neobacillus bataviensis LMG 21833]|uniref:General stress protein n=1 Tax=Neobacillus bataviensis LMG 21833 TaxID=1117379 RepID=K6CVZ3_9BACI|nr:DUF948 domain-containing protein [Neobacillus bataviensis]EKN64417.1 hypothetical protein BABA_23320 [Neobacillus bataviensis LMG 21833]